MIIEEQYRRKIDGEMRPKPILKRKLKPKRRLKKLKHYTRKIHKIKTQTKTKAEKAFNKWASL